MAQIIAIPGLNGPILPIYLMNIYLYNQPGIHLSIIDRFG